MNVQGVLLLIGFAESFFSKVRERIEENGEIDKDEYDDILREVIIDAIPGGSLLLSVVDGLKNLADKD